MAVVTKYGPGRKDPSSLSDIIAAFGEGRPRILSGSIAVANGDSINSKHYWGKIPSHAVLDPRSLLYHTAVTGLTDYDLGLEFEGALVTLDGLADGLDLSAAANKNPFAAIGTALMGKQLWQLAALGLTRDPGRTYDLVGTMKTAAAAAGTLSMFAAFIKN